MGKKEEISIGLISRYLANECSAGERKQVEAWKIDNQQEFLKYQAVWVDTGHLHGVPTTLVFDTDQAWERVSAQIKKSKSRSISVVAFMRIAAVLLIGFGLGYWISLDDLSGPGSFSIAESIGTVSLTDGSSVTLNQNSSVSYADFDPKNREVSLSGEGYFDVRSDPGNPFLIHAGKVDIQVLGTTFNVRMDKEGSVSVEVYSGIVLVQTDTEKLELKAGEASLYKGQEDRLTKVPSNKSGLTTFWKDRKLTFDDQNLTEVVNALEKAYNVDILMMGDKLANCRLHVSFDNSTLEEVFEVISLTLELNVKKEGNTYLISGKGCEN